MDLIDYKDVMDMLDWNQRIEVQETAIAKMRTVIDISMFFQPCDDKYNKNVWENCARIVSERTDAELRIYLRNMFEWIQDLNWPGASIIMNRLILFKDEKTFEEVYAECICCAEGLSDDIWKNNIMVLSQRRRDIMV